MKNMQTMLRVVALMTILRDDLEEIEFQRKFKNITNMWLKEANKYMDFIADGGEESNAQLIELTQAFEQRLKITDENLVD